MELNVWTSSQVVKATQDKNNEWDVTVKRGDGSTRVLHVRHVVSAIGLGGNNPCIPDIPGKDEFQGQALHSIFHNSAQDHIGKKVFIVGSATSGMFLFFSEFRWLRRPPAHDIAADYVHHGVGECRRAL